MVNKIRGGKEGRATPQHPDFIKHYGFQVFDLGFWGLNFGFWVSDVGFWGLDFGFWVSDCGFAEFSFQIPNAIDKLKIVNCLNDWLRVDAGGVGGLAPQQGRGVWGAERPSSHRSSDLSKFIFD